MEIISFVCDSKDDLIRAICDDYWAQNENGDFKFKVPEVAAKHAMRTHAVTRTVKQHAIAMFKGCVCGSCGAPLVTFVSRAEATYAFYAHREGLCADCTERARQEEHDRRWEEAVGRARDAYESDRHETLNRLELNYFIALSRVENAVDAARTVGLSFDRSKRLFRRLVDADLVLYSEADHSYFILPEYRQKLEKVFLEYPTVPLLGSPAVKKLYRMLKTENMYVFPEVPICAFVPRAAVEHLLTSKSKVGYYLTCRVDFLVCDKDTRPKLAVEYHGSYHGDANQREKDEFKRALLECVGLPLDVYTINDLKNGNIEGGDGS